MLCANVGPGIVSGVQTSAQIHPCRSLLNRLNCTDRRTVVTTGPAGEAMSKIWPSRTYSIPTLPWEPTVPWTFRTGVTPRGTPVAAPTAAGDVQVSRIEAWASTESWAPAVIWTRTSPRLPVTEASARAKLSAVLTWLRPVPASKHDGGGGAGGGAGLQLVLS